MRNEIAKYTDVTNKTLNEPSTMSEIELVSQPILSYKECSFKKLYSLATILTNHTNQKNNQNICF